MEGKIGKNQIKIAVVVVTVILSLLFGSKIFETVKKGTYQIKQAAVTGKMSAKMVPGLWLQLFGDIQVWPKADTFYFTADSEEGEGKDQSIEVRFNDGSLSRISGTVRITMPTSEEQVLSLITEKGYKSFVDLEQKLILPHVRNSLRLAANLMSARESYAEKRPDYISWTWDQIQNGVYKTKEEERKVKDLLSGEEITKLFKTIKEDKDGNPLREVSPLDDLGIIISNFEVKKFIYSDKVQEQIATQQAALMAVETAIAQAKEAEQNKLTIIEVGKANVEKARYEKEESKVRALVEARKEKEVAELHAQKALEVAKLDKQSAEFTKQKDILLGEGEAKRKSLVMAADGALKLKTEVYERVMGRFAQEFGKQKWVSEVVFNSGESSKSSGNEAANLISILTATTLKDLGLNMAMPKGKIASQE
ncbi:hypothetical protein KKF19_03055 [Patescibacteria group bacterium]|nr:hypothetical protein [Patescibacteria group bacterium]